MSRVLVTGGAGTIGAAVVRRLLRDGDWEVRVSDQREAPDWMASSCEIAPRRPAAGAARRAPRMSGCTHLIHLAAIVGGIANFHKLPHTLLEVNPALYNSVFRAALEERVERLLYVSSSMVFERATRLPDAGGARARVPRAAVGLRLLEARRRGLVPRAERRARPAVHDLPALQRVRAGRAARRRARNRARGARPDPQGAVGPAAARDLRFRRADPYAHARGRHRGRHRRPRSAHPAAENEDFNISASDERTIADIARIVWEACGRDPSEFELRHLPSFEVDVQRRWPSVEKAERLLGWRAQVDLETGIADTVRWLREQQEVAR